MQVRPVISDATFAIVGGATPEKFKIEQSAHAFRILSDTLYRDKIRAVVREVLCNAVDAHIAAGIADRPVEAQVKDGVFTVRDYGPGIADDRMVDIFCTYFGSTKTSDDRQTGGFGLGAKAPFAYADHFTVTSAHKGIRTVYAIHVGDEDSGGVPVCRKMVSTPCGEDSGLTVNVPVDPKDAPSFTEAITRIATEGGMKVKLDGDLIPAPDYRPIIEGCGYGLIRRDYHMQSRINVLYGNVLYPVEGETLKRLISSADPHIPNAYDLVIYAPPSSISIVPSRESLGLDPRTVAFLEERIADFLKLCACDSEQVREKVIVEELKGVSRLDYLPRVRRYGFWRLTSRYSNDISAQTVVGEPERILFECVRHRMCTEMSRGEVLDALVKRYREGGHALRQIRHKMARDEEVGWNKSSISTLEAARWAVKDTIKHRTKAAIRIAMAGNAVEFLRYRPNFKDKLGSVRVQKYPGLDGEEMRLVLAPTVKAADTLKSQGFHILTYRLTDEQIAAIKAKAEKFGVPVTEVGALEKKPRPKKKAKPVETPKYLALADMPVHVDRYQFNGFACLPTPHYREFEPKHYLAITQRRLGDRTFEVFTRASRSTFIELQKRFPDAAVVHTPKMVRDIEKRRVKSVAAEILSQVETLEAEGKDDFLLAYLLANFLDVSAFGWRDENEHLAVRLARKLLSYDIRFAEPLFGLSPARIDRLRDHWMLARMFRYVLECGGRSEPQKLRDRMHQAKLRIEAASRTRFKYYATSCEARYRLLEPIMFIATITGGGDSMGLQYDTSFDDIYDLLMAERRRWARSRCKSQNIAKEKEKA